MNDKTLQVFQNEQFGSIRAVTVNNEPWLVGKDVAAALGYTNPRKALIDHVDDEDKGVTKCDTLGGAQEMTIINESGLYSLILSSKLPSAKKFKRWVTSEVLPAIRKSGRYDAGSQESPLSQIAGLTKCIEGLASCINTLSGQVERLKQAEQTSRPALPQRTTESLPVSATAQLMLRILQELEQAMPYAFGEVQIGNRRLCRLLNIKSPHTLKAARRELVEAGCISVSPGVKGRPSIYFLAEKYRLGTGK